MFYIEEAQMIKNAGERELNMESRRECEEIMGKIYSEDPSFWPYGLNMSGHDGGVYMIREASTKSPVGFVGWQERDRGREKVGYYSVGVLPQYRGNGYAKGAVASLLHLKSAGVDRVEAFVLPHNKPSLALAEALNVPVVHDA